VQLLQFPNLANWTSSGTFGKFEQQLGYSLFITLDAGSTYTPTGNNSWLSGNTIGALGQDNFVATAANSTFDVIFVQHEPGPNCGQLIDIPFADNLLACQRYYQKSNNYAQLPGTTNYWSELVMVMIGSATCRMGIKFPVSIATAPTVVVNKNRR
jgi:hypothetical protein